MNNSVDTETESMVLSSNEAQQRIEQLQRMANWEIDPYRIKAIAAERNILVRLVKRAHPTPVQP